MAESALLADPAGMCRGGLRWERDEPPKVDCIRWDTVRTLSFKQHGQQGSIPVML